MARTRRIGPAGAEWFVLAAALTVAILAPRARADDEGEKTAAPVEAKAVLERLKELAGTWNFVGAPEGEATAKVIYRVTAAGTAVVEEQFPGSDHEMVSIYHLDGDDLLMTHYCAVGNQPRMKLDRAASTLDDLRFDFDGGTNLDPNKDMHIHDARLHLENTGEGRLTSDWTAFQGGTALDTTTFHLVRE